MNVENVKLKTSFVEFKNYPSKPIVRKACLISNQVPLSKVEGEEATWQYGEGEEATWQYGEGEEATWQYGEGEEALTFKAHMTPKPGDYICYLNDVGVYHVDAKTFAERNVIDQKDVLQEIEDNQLNAPKVSPEHINQLMSLVQYHGVVVPGTTTTLVCAYLPIGDSSFTLATGESSCVSKENFSESIGYKYAVIDAEAKARQMLWVLEGYLLQHRLNSQVEVQHD